MRVHFSVRDTGIGISPEHQQKIFKAFTQADGSSTRRFGGTGLGLAISTSLVGLMNGHIWVDSELGKGSTFHFTALFRLSSDTALPSRPSSNALTDLRVLIVDDNATNRLILREAVSEWRMQPTCVEDAQRAALEALQRAAELGTPFAFVLLDAMMPEMDGFEVARLCKSNHKLDGTTIMMLSSADSDGDSVRCRELGIARYLRKPISTRELHDAFLAALNDEPAENLTMRISVTNRETPVHRLNILLAEDNLVNQRVAVSILERRGHVVQPVGNGKEALEALACERFDLVLMDVQMPEMNGLEATAAIRRKEQETGGHVPIIAMTAHAMKGDRERCLEAGMDDYLAKPVEPKAMRTLIERWGALAKRDQSPDENTNSCEPVSPTHQMKVDTRTAPSNNWPVDSQLFDFSSLRDRVENDLDLFAEMIDLYMSSSPLLLKDIESAVADRDGDKINRAAHTLKGVLKNMCATTCAKAALQLETIGRSGDIESADQSLVTLKIELQRLQSVLTEVAQGVKV